MSFHTIIIRGRVGKEPDMRYTPDGKAVCTISVAVDDGYGEKKSVIWFRVTAWERQAEMLNNYVVRGQEILVEGKLQHDEKGGPRMFTRKDGTAGTSFELTAHQIDLGTKPRAVEAEPADQGEIPF